MPQTETTKETFVFADPANPTPEEIVAYLEVSNKTYSTRTRAVKSRQTTSETDERKLNSKEVYDYYWGVRQLRMLEDEMQHRFPQGWLTRRKAVENVTKTITDQISVVYKSPPDRTVSMELGVDASEAEQEAMVGEKAEIQSLYDQIYMDAKIDLEMQKLERYQNFDRTSLIQVRYIESEKRVKLSVLPQFLFDVVLDDDGNLSAVILSDFIEEERIEDKKYWVWTKDSFYRMDSEFNIVPDESNPNHTNPDGIIPFIMVHQVVPDSGWYCDADINLSNLNLNINLILSDALHLAEFQVHGQLIGNNVKFGRDVEWGPETLVEYESKNPDQPAKMEFLTPNANFDGLFDTVNRVLGGFANSRGLPINMFSIDKQGVESGVALKIRNAPLIELRESQEEIFRNVERELLDMITTIWNNNAGLHGAGMLPEELEVNVTYNRPDDAFESMQERIGGLMTLKAHGLIKLTEVVMALKPSFSEDDAKKYLMEVAEQEKMYGKSNDMGNINQVGTDMAPDIESSIAEAVRPAEERRRDDEAPGRNRR